MNAEILQAVVDLLHEGGTAALWAIVIIHATKIITELTILTGVLGSVKIIVSGIQKMSYQDHKKNLILKGKTFDDWNIE